MRVLVAEDHERLARAVAAACWAVALSVVRSVLMLNSRHGDAYIVRASAVKALRDCGSV